MFAFHNVSSPCSCSHLMQHTCEIVCILFFNFEWLLASQMCFCVHVSLPRFPNPWGRGHFFNRSFYSSWTDHIVGEKDESSSDYSRYTRQCDLSSVESQPGWTWDSRSASLLSSYQENKWKGGMYIHCHTWYVLDLFFLHRTCTWNTFEVSENHLGITLSLCFTFFCVPQPPFPKHTFIHTKCPRAIMVLTFLFIYYWDLFSDLPSFSRVNIC